MIKDIVKRATDPDEPGREVWIKFKVSDSRIIPGLDRNFIWTFKHTGNRSGYDTYNGYVISAKSFDDAWAVFAAADNYVDDEYDHDTPWIVTVIGIDISDEGDRQIESSFKAG